MSELQVSEEVKVDGRRNNGRKKAQKFSGEKVEIMIHTDSSEAGKEPVVVGVDGRVLRIKRGKRVEIPIEHFYVLRDSQFTVFNDTGDGEATTPRFAMTRY